MDKEVKTIGELKEMPKNDGWEEPQTIGESEGWMGTIEEWQPIFFFSPGRYDTHGTVVIFYFARDVYEVLSHHPHYSTLLSNCQPLK